MPHVSTFGLMQVKQELDGAHGGLSFWDFVIDGQRLTELIYPGGVTPFGWLPDASQRTLSTMLLLDIVSDLPSGRVPLFVCPLCADYACGVLTTRAEKQGELIVWSDFVFEGQTDEVGEIVIPYAYPKLYFEALSYREELSTFLL